MIVYSINTPSKHDQDCSKVLSAYVSFVFKQKEIRIIPNGRTHIARQGKKIGVGSSNLMAIKNCLSKK